MDLELLTAEDVDRIISDDLITMFHRTQEEYWNEQDRLMLYGDPNFKGSGPVGLFLSPS